MVTAVDAVSVAVSCQVCGGSLEWCGEDPIVSTAVRRCFCWCRCCQRGFAVTVTMRPVRDYEVRAVEF